MFGPEGTTMDTPRHIAFIMDGNGRWAQARGLPRSAGHKAGYEQIPEILEACIDLGIPVISVFVWSTENWARPEAEVSYLVSIHKSPISVSRGAIGRSPVPYPDTCVYQISGYSTSSNYNVVIGRSFRNTSP